MDTSDFSYSLLEQFENFKLHKKRDNISFNPSPSHSRTLDKTTISKIKVTENNFSLYSVIPKIIANQCFFENVLLPENQLENFIIDENSSIIISSYHARKLKLYTGQLVNIELSNMCQLCSINTQVINASSLEDNKSKTVVVLVSADENLQHNCSKSSKEVTIIINLILWFNISSHCGNHFEVVTCHCFLKVFDKEESDQDHPQNTIYSSHLEFASKVYVSKVKSIDSKKIDSTYDVFLEEHFSKPKILQEGDILAIHLKECSNALLSAEEGSDFYYPLIFYKVIKICEKELESVQNSKLFSTITDPSSLFLVDNQHTTLIQDKDVFSYVPSGEIEALRPNMVYQSDDLLRAWIPTSSQLVSSIMPFLQSSRQQLRKFIPPVFLEIGPERNGFIHLIRAIANKFYLHFCQFNFKNLDVDSAPAIENKIKQILSLAISTMPCILYLENIDHIAKDKDGFEDRRLNSFLRENLFRALTKEADWPIITIATMNTHSIPNDLQDLFLMTFDLKFTDELARKQHLELLISPHNHLFSKLNIDKIVNNTGGLYFEDLKMYLSFAIENLINRNSKEMILEEIDLNCSLKRLHKLRSDLISVPKIPNVHWDDIGGLEMAKQDILDTIQLPLKYPHIFSNGLRRSGILLYGPPGTGKTLLAKAIATECSLNFINVKGPELLNMYVGQSEENIREVFKKARLVAPCVVFFDELDSLVPNRGNSSDSGGGVMNRVVSQLLAEMDGLHELADIFFVGATNRPDLIDPAFLRPGRFDKMVYLGAAELKETKVKILKAVTRKFNLGLDCNLNTIAEKCPNSMTGADFYALCSDAMFQSMKKLIDICDSNGGIEPDNIEITVNMDDFNKAFINFKPSLTIDEINEYKNFEKIHNV